MNTDLQNTPCQRGCCWTPHGVCATNYQCVHHHADKQRAVYEATQPADNSRIVFPHPTKQTPEPLPMADRILRDSVLTPTFSHQEPQQ